MLESTFTLAEIISKKKKKKKKKQTTEKLATSERGPQFLHGIGTC